MRAGALTRALRVIESHPEFVRWREPVEAGGAGAHAACFEFGVDMPPQWAADGASPTGVRSVEPIEVWFPDDYPNTAPDFRLRLDFPRCFPHLEPGTLDEAPKPCLVRGSETNLFRRLGVGGMLAQLSTWLHRAAHDRLNDDPNVWEPARRDHVHDHVVVELLKVQALPAGRHTFAYRAGAYSSMHVKGGLRFHQLTLLDEPVKLTPEFWAQLTKGRHNNTLSVGRTLCVVLSPDVGREKTPFVDAQYRPDTVQDIATLKAALTDWHCRRAFDNLLSSINHHLTRNPNPKSRRVIPMAILVNVPRPRPIQGTKSSIETLAYILELDFHTGSALIDKTRVRLAAVIEQMSAELLQRFNQQSTQTPTHGWASIGCGSLGTKIATYAARQGRAPKALVDPEWLAPHNFARNALTPDHPNAAHLPPMPKVTALEFELTCLQQKADASPIAIEQVLSDPGQRERLQTLCDWLWVNTTASVGVRNALTAAGEDLKLPRIAEGALFGAGRVGYLALTGSDHNPDCSELFALAVQQFSQAPSLAEAALSEQAQFETILTGLGCGSETMPVSDATVTLHAAGMTTALLDLHEQDLPATGRLWIGEQAPHAMGVQWKGDPVEAFLRVPLKDSGDDVWTLHVAAPVAARIEADVRAHSGTETGGVLWGCVNEALGAIYVVDLVEPPPDSERTATTFVLGTEGLAVQKMERAKKSYGYLHCVGTWHSHLLPTGPSVLDRQVARQIENSSDHANALLIWTPDGYCGLLADNAVEDGRESEP